MSTYSDEWFEGWCRTCSAPRRVREFAGFGDLCADCYFDRRRMLREQFRAAPGSGTHVGRAANSAGRVLGALTRSALFGLRGAKRLVTAGPVALSRFVGAFGSRSGVERPRSKDAAPPIPPAEPEIRSIVIEELQRVQEADDRPSIAELEERVRSMSTMIETLKQRIGELSKRGPVSEADVMSAVGSLDSAEPLTHGERAVLVTVFRRNVALQKPDLAEADLKQSIAK